MTGHESGGEELSKVLEVSDRCLFYQYGVNIVFPWCFVFHFFQVQLYFMSSDWLCEGIVLCSGSGYVCLLCVMFIHFFVNQVFSCIVEEWVVWA